MTTPPDHISRFAAHLSSARPARGLDEPRPRHRAHVLAIDRSNPDTTRVLVEHRAPHFDALHQWPGQYTTMAIGDQAPRYIAMASAPGEQPGRWEFLLSSDSSLGRAIELDAPLSLTAPEGAGFHSALWGRGPAPRLLFCSGSGIAALRALINHTRTHAPDVLARTHLYYGVGGIKDVAYTRAIMAWELEGMHIHMAYNQGLEGYPLYVTQAFEAHPVALDQAQVGLSGAGVMIREVVKLLLSKGLSMEQVHLNVDVAKFDPLATPSSN